MADSTASPERVTAFSDGVFAVLITVLVLDLRPPAGATYSALLEHWPTWLSYAVSYVFIAIVWANHHYLLHFASRVSPRLIWFNFAHLFSVSLLPVATAWMAESELGAQPVSFYALVFFLVNLTYLLLIRELIPGDQATPASAALSRSMRRRSAITLGIFGASAVLALTVPVVALGLCCCCLLAYLRPDAPRAFTEA